MVEQKSPKLLMWVRFLLLLPKINNKEICRFPYFFVPLAILTKKEKILFR